jgi:hypothetical protein
MKNVLGRLSATLILSVGALSYAQENPPTQQPPAQRERQRSQDEGTPATIRGCLTKGSQAQEYVVADQKSGEKVSFAGSAKLDSYVNQTVELTGQIVERGGEKAFQPQAIKSVASTCKTTPDK